VHGHCVCALQAFKAGPDADKIFFAELDFDHSKELYVRLNIKQLPFIFYWGPEAVAKDGRSIKISKASQVCAVKRHQHQHNAGSGLAYLLLMARHAQSIHVLQQHTAKVRTASGGGPLGQLSLVFSLASMSSPLTLPRTVSAACG